MALVRRAAPWLLLPTWLAACNSIFGIEEGTPRPATPDSGGEASGGAGTTNGGSASGGMSNAGTTNGGSANGGMSNAGTTNGGSSDGGATDGGTHAGGQGGGSSGAPEAGDGGVAGGGGAGAAAGEAGFAGQGDDACHHARWPARPKPGDATVVPQFVLAARSLVLNDTELVGRDLDDTCTCPEVSTCAPPAALDRVCDGSRGGDANVNKVMATVVESGISAFSEEQLALEITKGRAGLLLRISGYNGQPNDDFVSVEVFGKVWTNGVVPQHGGNDVWSPYADSIEIGNAVDWALDAYVADSLLVARLPHFSLAFRPNVGENDNAFTVELEEAVLSGTLEQGTTSFVLKNGNMAARWPTAAALRAFRVFDYFGSFMCNGNLAFGVLKPKICGYADIMGTAAQDNQAHSCDAISWGAGFETEPAKLGSPNTPTQVPTTCAETWNPSCF